MRRIFFIISLILFGVICWAQKIDINPTPQSISWGTKAFDNTAHFTITGEEYADPDAVRVLKNIVNKTTNNTESDVEIIIGEYDDSHIAQAQKLFVPKKTAGYYLKVQKDKVYIIGYDSIGTFYGVQTFAQIMQQNEVLSVNIKDYPDTPLRGVIEGFYGNPWSTEDRKAQFDFYGQNKMNIYVYGPKDDPYHRSQWRESYPEEQGKEIAELAQYARENKVDFMWAVHPGEDIQWNETDSKNVVKKFENMYDLGIRSFALFFDDITGSGTSAEKQAELLNYVTDNFVKKHDDVAPLALCPTQYSRGQASGDYLTTLGTTLYPDIRIMWTGNAVVDMINTSDVTWIQQQINRKAFIWWNYPVNDYCQSRLLMGKTYGNDDNINTYISAFCSNPMEYAEASKISLYSVADYTWNMKAYNSIDSWHRAINSLLPDCYDAFRIFCENNVDYGSTWTGLRRNDESETIQAEISTFKTNMSNGYKQTYTSRMREQLDSLVWAATQLKQSYYRGQNTRLFAEIMPWIEVMGYMGERGCLLMNMYDDVYDERPEDFVAHYKQMRAIQKKENAVMTRDFDGSLSAAHPVVAGRYVEPFLQEQLTSVISLYKSRYTTDWDIFNTKILTDGTYYIKYNNKYLTNVTPNASAVGDQPVWKEQYTTNTDYQKWEISLDSSSDRYKIVSKADGRYVNELGKFWNRTTATYSADWNTYILERLNGKYSIRNAGSGGSAYWSANTTGFTISTNTGDMKYSECMFEFIPVDNETITYPIIDTSKSYLIVNEDGLALTDKSNDQEGKLAFDVIATDNNDIKRQLFKFSKVSTTGRWKITSVLNTSAYITNEGKIAKTAYNANTHTYILSEGFGLYAIRNAGDGGTKYWNVQENQINYVSTTLDDSYIFRLTEENEVLEINSINTQQKRTNITYNLSGQKVNAAYRGIIISNGKKIIQFR